MLKAIAGILRTAGLIFTIGAQIWAQDHLIKLDQAQSSII